MVQAWEICQRLLDQGDALATIVIHHVSRGSKRSREPASVHEQPERDHDDRPVDEAGWGLQGLGQAERLWVNEHDECCDRQAFDEVEPWFHGGKHVSVPSGFDTPFSHHTMSWPGGHSFVVSTIPKQP
jgi:hypothetical protein